MRDELDLRIREALQADVNQLPLMATEGDVHQRLERRRTSPVLAIVGGLAAGVIVLAMVAMALSLLAGGRNVGPPAELPRAPDVICEGARDARNPLQCAAAVRLALASLPGGTPPLRATFLRGRAFTCEEGCAEDIRRDATVVIETSGPGPDLYVPVILDAAEGVSVAADPTEVPGGEFSAADPAHPRATWQYVALGTGFTGNASWPRSYADHVSEDLGVSVEVWNMAAPSGPLRADESLERMRTDEALRALIAEAELITIGPALQELRAPMLSFAGESGTCGGEDDQDCIRAAMAGVRADWEALLDEVVTLRSPEQANMVVITQAAWLADWACGDWGTRCWEVLVGYWMDFYDFVADSARVRGLKVADTLAALHAPGVFDGPANPDYVAANGMDLTAEASSVVADVVRAVGY